MEGGTLTRLLITGARAPSALHLARLFQAAGHCVVMADSQAHPVARSSRFIDHYAQLPAPATGFAAFGQAVADLVQAQRIDLVIPTCEEIFYLAAARDRLNKTIPLLAPRFELLAEVHNKFRFTELANGFGADPPPTLLLTSKSDLAELADDPETLVFKPVWSRFGDRVLIRPKKHALQQLTPTPDDPWVAQAFLPGEELCCWALAKDGVLLACQTYKPLYRAGQGAGLAFAPVRDPVINRFVAGIVQSLNWTGQISFDFRRDAQGQLHVTECNPRTTSGVHFFAPADALPKAFLNAAPASASATKPMTLPLAMLAYGLPQAITSGTLSTFWKDFGSFGSILHWPGERNLGLAQLRSLIEIATLALRKRKSLKAAATDDIEWNGQPLG